VDSIALRWGQRLAQSMQRDLSCPLCRELFREPVTAECGHTSCGRWRPSWTRCRRRTRPPSSG
uniref:Zinc finger RING-type eukaryotic domain-containing protein n=1 Tax=Apteryx owenii TaxID=8824 RepID=A0A8B9SAJ7_APTOW